MEEGAGRDDTRVAEQKRKREGSWDINTGKKTKKNQKNATGREGCNLEKKMQRGEGLVEKMQRRNHVFIEDEKKTTN